MLTVVPFGSDLYRETLAFRETHLRRPLGLAQDPADRVGEEEQIHLAVVVDGTVQGTVVLKPLGNGIFKLRQMAVDPVLRGRGTGRTLVAFAEAVARERGGSRIELHARTTAQAFYERLGYRAMGEPFKEVTIPHIAMARDI